MCFCSCLCLCLRLLLKMTSKLCNSPGLWQLWGLLGHKARGVLQRWGKHSQNKNCWLKTIFRKFDRSDKRSWNIVQAGGWVSCVPEEESEVEECSAIHNTYTSGWEIFVGKYTGCRQKIANRISETMFGVQIFGTKWAKMARIGQNSARYPGWPKVVPTSPLSSVKTLGTYCYNNLLGLNN